jgi:primosomal protein N'
LLANNNEWQQCLHEASLTHISEHLHCLFSLILQHYEPSQPNILWRDFSDALCDNLCRQLQCVQNTTEDNPQQEIYDFSLFLIDKDLCLHGFSLSSFPSMPAIHEDWQRRNQHPYIVEQLNYSTNEENTLFDNSFTKLNNKQHNTFNKIYKSTCEENGNPFFLHGPGGTGKTFVYTTLCH